MTFSNKVRARVRRLGGAAFLLIGIAAGGSGPGGAFDGAIFASPTIASPTIATLPAPHWRMVWEDNFDGVKLDRRKWQPEESCWGGGNQERQCYTDRHDNIQVAQGMLRLIAKPESFVGLRYPAHHSKFNDESMRQEYTSGKINTLGLAHWTYGRMSARIKLPAGQGTWPAFWMLPSANYYGGWPLSGEIDIMEAVNLETPCAECPQKIDYRTSGAIHFGSKAPQNSFLFSYSDGAYSDGKKYSGPAQNWHIYSVEWAQGIVQWLVDGRVFMRVTASDWYSAAAKAQEERFAPFDQPFYLNLNLAVGGNLAERGSRHGFDAASFPAELLVDWVRVEQCAGDDSGIACLSNQPWEGRLQRYGPSLKDGVSK